MTQFNEKRQFRRFEIEGAEGKYKRKSFSSSFKPFSKPCHVMNLSVGGIALLCEEEFKMGEKVVMQLLIPEEAPLKLSAEMIWQKKMPFDIDNLVGFKFAAFNKNKEVNTLESLNILRRLYTRYT